MTNKILGGKYSFNDKNDFIGCGNHGQVYRCKPMDLNDPREYCVKVISKDFILNEQKQEKHEINIMKKISLRNCENLVEVIDIYDDSSAINIILELCDHDLTTEFKKLKSQEKWYDQCDVIEIMQQIMKGFKFLYDMKIIHGNIKLSNILVKTIHKGTVNERKLYKISDFDILNGCLKQETQTRSPYLAPEQYLQNYFSEECDIFSYGIVCYQLCYKGEFPYDVEKYESIEENLKNLEYHPLQCQKLEGEHGQQLQNFMERMIVYSAEQRISFDEIFQHSLLKIVPKSKKEQTLQEFHVKCDTQELVEIQLFNEQKQHERISIIITIFYRKFTIFEQCVEFLEQANSNDIEYQTIIYNLLQLGQIQLSYAMAMIHVILPDIHPYFKEENDIQNLINILLECKNTVHQYDEYKQERDFMSFQYRSWTQRIKDFCNRVQFQLYFEMQSSNKQTYEELLNSIKQGNCQKFEEQFYREKISEVNYSSKLSGNILSLIQNVENDFPIQNYEIINPEDICIDIQF